ncbi:TonB-dependent receptor [Limnovirga soli]|uniref:TonB-dependent receptor plug domain-containing protein n=1 Tax=Limnovirga soli TaxID=2656915 RepID=A0A8J8FGM5_9BACT|nr:TonB-dependent receptor [Limnovirga soli]NNV54729.1 TonB-dependent receptor plug domain-containing protein [Limnovirga soli]
MKKCLFLCLFIYLAKGVFGQYTYTGVVLDSKTNQPIEGAYLITDSAAISTFTDVSGKFRFAASSASCQIEIKCIGYTGFHTTISYNNALQILLNPGQTLLQDVVVTANAGEQFKAIGKTDISMRGVNNSQEVLRIVPGLVIGQHQGGGKAEQIFLRGFDCDHGTDIALAVDGIPINMVSHAHGQGYADSHFIIPETIENVNFKKGPYAAEKGDFATTGAVDFNTRNALTNNMIKLEGGMFNTYRAMAMFNVLNRQAIQKQQSWYMAAEYRYTDAYFNYPQHFNRFNFFTKYNGRISKHSYASISASHLNSKWDASGQIPGRAVEKGMIGFYGALDPTEGGNTSRTNINAQLVATMANGDLMKHQLYYSYYKFDLHTNFTFFLEDSINGDQIRQKENRQMAGYNGSYMHKGYLGNVSLVTEAGMAIRADMTSNSSLSHTKDRYTLLTPIKLGDITQTDIAAYLNETIRFNQHLSLNVGLRFDQFNNRYNNQLASDSTLTGIGLYTANANIISPKTNLYYHVNDALQLYISTGKGFHSNDTRAVVVQKGVQVLPGAYGADIGMVSKPAKNVLINAALWYLYLQQEFVYSGDGGIVEPSGKTRRVGIDFSGRYQPFRFLYIDADVNYAHGRSIDNAKGQDYIPLAPVITSTGGITYTNKNGFNGSLRYRYVGNRPANEDYSLTANGYCIADMVLNYTKPCYEIGLGINNIFNTKWKETQFATLTRLQNETLPVNEVCFTAGTPIAAKISLTWFFK